MSKPTKIVWMSKHPPTASQLYELERRYPNYFMVVDPAPFSGADDIVGRFHAAQADEMVVVAPWTVIQELCKRGLRPLYARMRQVNCNDPTKEVRIKTRRKSRCYKFERFMRWTGIELKLEELPPLAAEGDKS